jgi:hypothetical protein
LVGPMAPATTRGFCGRLLGQLGRLSIDLIHHGLHAVISLGYAGGGKRIGFDDVASGFQIGVMDAYDDVGAGQRQQVVIPLQIVHVILESLPTEGRFIEPVSLDHGAHGAIHDQDTLREQRFEELALRSCRHIDIIPC